ncbi:MAG: peptidoglycan-binding protein [Phaeodactylibacter sp.]|nr:peptidoglycan-binding protein [Phaeodactylibacter sp.]
MTYPLQYKAIHPDVIILKNILKALGYHLQPVQNPQYFDASLRDAVKAFQKKNKVAVTGVVDQQTGALLQKAYKEMTGGKEDEWRFHLFIYQANGDVFEGLTVEAWDQQTNQKITQTTKLRTDHYQLLFKRSRLADSSPNYLPSVYFRVFFQEELIHTTVNTPFQNARPKQYELKLKIQPPEAKVEGPAFAIAGEVLDKLGRPLPKATVLLYTMSGSKKKAGATDQQGQFLLPFSDEESRELLARECPDFYFQISYDGKRVADTKEELIWNIGVKEKITITADIIAEIFPAPDDLPATRPFFLGRNNTPDQLKEAQSEIYGQLVHMAGKKLEQQVAEVFQTSDDELKKALASIKWDACVNKNVSVKDFLLANLKLQRISRSAYQKAERLLKKAELPGSLDQLLQPDRPIRQNPLFSKVVDQSFVYQAGKQAQLPDYKIESLLRKGLTQRSVSNHFLKALVEDKSLKKKEAKALGLTLDLHRLLDEQNSLVEAALQGRLTNGGQQPLRSVKELAVLKAGDWAEVLKENQITPPAEQTVEDYGWAISKRIELRFPTTAYLSRYTPPAKKKLAESLKAIGPLFENNEKVFRALRFDELKLSGLDKQQVEKMRLLYEALSKTINYYHGFGLHRILDDAKLPVEERIEKANEQIEKLHHFYENNKELPLLSLRYGADSEDLKRLNFDGLKLEDQRMILRHIKTDQHLYRMTQDVDQVYQLKAAGYYSSRHLQNSTPKSISRRTGIREDRVAYIQRQAEAENTRKSILLSGIWDHTKGVFKDLQHIQNQHPNAKSGSYAGFQEWLRRIDGYEEFFGSLDYCNCEHCQSIYSPAAYFTDLMFFVENNVLRPYFDELGKQEHYLHLKNRRPDLWHLELTCAHTDTPIPYLDLINEVLENNIALRKRGSEAYVPDQLKNRRQIEEEVYRQAIYDDGKIHSFSQPFLLPLEELRTYLQHFPISLEAIVETVQPEDGDGQRLARARLGLSEKAFKIIAGTYVDSDGRDSDTIGFLSDLYGIPFSTTFSGGSHVVDPFDAQSLLKPMQVKRKELTELIETTYVSANDADPIPIFQEKRNEDSIQNDIERVKGVKVNISGAVPSIPSFDRLHRFTRLWKQVPWNIRELDLVLTQLLDLKGPHPGILNEQALRDIAFLIAIQRQFSLGVEEVCVLMRHIPERALSDSGLSMMDRRFNLPPFKKSDDEDTFPAERKNFSHPSFQPDDEESKENLSRLLAGLQVDDEKLYQLIDGLDAALGNPRAFSLSRENLSLLYRHALLARLLSLSIPQLFQLIKLIPGFEQNYVGNNRLDDLNNLLTFYSWWKTTNYSLDELTFLTGADVPEVKFPRAEDVFRELRKQVEKQQSLIFSDTVFSYFEKVNEDASRQIILQNMERVDSEHRVFEMADVKIYRLVDSYEPDDIIIDSVPENDAGEKIVSREALHDVLQKYRAPLSLFLTKTLFSVLEGITEDVSKQIFSDNESLFAEVPSDHLYWLRTGCSSKAALARTLAIPKTVLTNDGVEEDIHIPVVEDEVIGFLDTYRPATVLVNFLAQRFGLSSKKLNRLIKLGGLEEVFHGPDLAKALQGKAEVDETSPISKAIGNLQRLSVLFKAPVFDEQSLQEEISGHLPVNLSADGIVTDEEIATIRRVNAYRKLLEKLDEADLRALANILAKLTGGGFRLESGKDQQDLAAVLQTEVGLSTTLFHALDLPADPFEALAKLKRCAGLAQYLGVGGETLQLFFSTAYPDLVEARNAILSAFRLKYPTEEQWQEKVEPFENKIRSLKRDALTDYFLHSLPGIVNPSDSDEVYKEFRNTHDLFSYFLIDTELEGCARTSRLVAAISSVQQYIQRVTQNLEQDDLAANEEERLHVFPQAIPQVEWEWRKHYRVWEANRKVFLYPENYIEPDLRDNKTELFENLESELLQQEINADTVEQAYRKYMKGFVEVANLKIAGAYHDKDIRYDEGVVDFDHSTDRLYIFAYTNPDVPVYYYRVIENAYLGNLTNTLKYTIYNSWEKIDIQIPVKLVSPIVIDGQLCVFWMQIRTRPMNEPIEGTNIFYGYKHTLEPYFSWHNYDGSWENPQKLKLPEDEVFQTGDGVIEDKLFSSGDYERILEILKEQISPIERRPISYFPSEQILFKKIYEKYKDLGVFCEGDMSFSTEIPYTYRLPESGIYESVTQLFEFNISDERVKNLLTPKHGSNPHIEAKEEYTLSGTVWEKLFLGQSPANHYIVGGANTINGKIDFFNSTVQRQSSGFRIDGFHITFPTLKDTLSFFDYSVPFSPLGGAKVNQYATGFSKSAGRSGGGREIAEVKGEVDPDARLEIINRHVTIESGAFDGIAIFGNDQYLVLYDSKNDRYILSRIGTTISEELAKDLFDVGLESFLTVEYQKRKGEEDLKLIPLESENISELVKETIGKICFTGAYGTYYREIFFHIPFLIANHLNSQQKFAEAQQWYHYIFNPTAPLPTDASDTHPNSRVWQYLEFHQLDELENMRKILTDPQAIELYKKDPFSPHPIARLRPGTYQKSIFMKYIDNLLDWGDQLYTRDTMEDVNEATVLYIFAYELLGERPAELGPCRRRSKSYTYEALRPVIYGNLDRSEVLESYEIFMEDVVDTVSHHATDIIYSSDYLASGDAYLSVHEGDFSSLGVKDILDESAPVSEPISVPEAKNLSDASYLQMAPVFCIPPNKDLLGYWDRVEDRLYKIRNCLNIKGIARQLSLFAPEIDPRLLVRAKADGLSIEDVLNNLSGNLPPYRFAFLMAKAKEYVGLLQGFGSALHIPIKLSNPAR